jgi:uncharacterized protein (TIGR02147 family)
MPSTREPDLFAYLDYRAYLRDVYEHKKSAQRGFSYRWFARKAGLSAPNYLQLVIQGKRNLTPETAQKFAVALGLDATEARFFGDLVGFNQASSAAEKNLYYERLGSYRRHRAVRSVERDEFDYCSTWYVPVVREFVTCPGFRPDPEWISKHLIPPISPTQAAQAIELLLGLGFLVRGPDGSLRQESPLLSTGPEVRSLAIGNFHRQMMERAAASIELVPREWRDISSLTVALSPQGLQEFKQEIVALRAKLLERSAAEQNPTRVVQLNFQLFPMAFTDEEPR